MTQRVLLLGLDHADAWELLEAAQHLVSNCPILVLHAADQPDQLRALAFGVTGLLSIQSAPDRILRTLDALVDDDAVIPAATLATFTRLVPHQHPAIASLSDEERQWLQALSRGDTIPQLAAATSWSERQIRRRLAGLYLRLGVSNRDQAIALTAKHGGVDS